MASVGGLHTAAHHAGDSHKRLAERAALVVTELASNALRHGRPPAVVRLLQADGCFTARSLASEVCWYTTEHAKHIWASFATDPTADQAAGGDV